MKIKDLDAMMVAKIFVPPPFRQPLRKLWQTVADVGEGPFIRRRVLKPRVREVHARRALRPSKLGFPAAKSEGQERLLSCLCRTEILEYTAFRYWTEQLGEPWRLDRKLWEFCYVCQALYERGVLRPGARGLGFAVGQEPLPSLFAAFGCRVLATDLPADDDRATPWAETGQWLEGLNILNQRGLCDPQAFQRLVSYMPCDMNQIPDELRDFDFTWSSCSFEHCGNLELGKRFLLRQMDCLKQGGVAVHTTEFNLTSNEHTLSEGNTVIYRRCDVEEMVQRLRSAGHQVELLDLTLGRKRADRIVDQPPYAQPFARKQHLRLVVGEWATTSVGLIITKGSA